jgi:hypothetical protein
MNPAMILALVQAEPEVLNAIIVILQAIQKFQAKAATPTV